MLRHEYCFHAAARDADRPHYHRVWQVMPECTSIFQWLARFAPAAFFEITRPLIVLDGIANTASRCDRLQASRVGLDDLEGGKIWQRWFVELLRVFLAFSRDVFAGLQMSHRRHFVVDVLSGFIY